MAVFTPVSEGAAAAFLEEYDIGELESLEPIAEGVENTNYKLRAGARGFVLTLFEKRTRAEDLPQILGLTAHLAAQAGAWAVRVHEVRATADAVRVARAVEGARAERGFSPERS